MSVDILTATLLVFMGVVGAYAFFDCLFIALKGRSFAEAE